MKILHVVPHTRPSGTTREWRLLLTAAPAGTHVLGDGRRAFDPRPLWELARRLREVQPDVVCAWGLLALRAVRLANRKAPVLVRAPLASGPLSRLDRWLLRGAAGVLAANQAAMMRCRQAGVAENRLRLVPPGVEQAAAPPAAPTPAIACVGQLRPQKGFYEALWAFDILQFVQRDAELLLAGEGPERSRLEQFTANIGLTQKIQFLGAQADIAAVWARASVVWVPSLADTGAGVVLEAMAAGRPVVASYWPGLAELIVDGETGFLVEPGNKMELARRTRLLFQDEAMRKRMGAAARRRVEGSFGKLDYVAAWAQAQQTLAA